MAIRNPLAWKTETEKPTRSSEKGGKTRVTIIYDCGFPNTLTIRGSGPHLSWEKGIPLKNVKKDEWVYETDQPFGKCEFKVLINDTIYESGPNRNLVSGSQAKYTPHF